MNLELTKIDVRSLPSMKLEQRRRLPNVKAVYIVFTSEAYLYVGKTESLVIRWMSHNRLKEVQEHVDVNIAWLECDDSDILCSTEIFFINALVPILNVRGFEKKITEGENRLFSFSYRDLREKTGIDINHWSDWFNGKVAPNFGTMEKIASDLEMPLMDFVEAFVERRRRTMEQREFERDGCSDRPSQKRSHS